MKVDYDEKAKSAVITFATGRQLKLSKVTKEQAETFAERHGPEFERRDCVLQTAGAIETRGAGNG